MIDCPSCSPHRAAGADLAGSPPAPGGPVTALEREVRRASRELLATAFLAESRADHIGNADARARDALGDLATATAKLMALEDLSARARLLFSVRTARAARSRVAPSPSAFRALDTDSAAFDRADFVTLGFDAIAADIIGATPLADDIAASVARTYSRYADTLRGSIAGSVLHTVQRQIAALVRDGATTSDFVAWSRRLTDGHVSDQYAATLARTQRNKAYNAGRVQQAFSPELDDWIIALTYRAVGDGDTRPNHRVNSGRSWSKRADVWRTRLPPNGYQ